MRQDAQLVRDSFELIREVSTPTAMLFYGRLFDLDPTLRGLFHVDFKAQSVKLMDTLALVVESADRLEQLRPTLRDLGRRHVDYGVRPEHYQTVSTALLWALAQAMQPDFDDDVRAAWTRILGEVCQEMLVGAEQG
ncbi:globin domain-containing protein [Paludibaculum fermentans]|uniref:globin domain-containing protein n=1 Tax=Paludibaculum fermentans TaxID=1473598 RepID=UPI003EB6E3D7